MLAESCAARGREAGWICAAESGGWLNVMPDGKHLGVGLATEHHDTDIVNWADELRSISRLGRPGRPRVNELRFLVRIHRFRVVMCLT